MSELIIERNFPADPETVFAFITRNENLLKWWGPESMNCTSEELDFSRLGPWSSVMVNAEGGRYKVSGEVLEISPPTSIEISWGWHDENDDRGHESKVRFEVSPNGEGGSLFRLIHTALADDESAANHNTGWTSSLLKLERLAN